MLGLIKIQLMLQQLLLLGSIAKNVSRRDLRTKDNVAEHTHLNRLKPSNREWQNTGENKMDNKIRDYISNEDFLQKAGYRTYKPKIGSFGHALIKASKTQGRYSFINKCLDSYFRKLRQQRKLNGNKEQNSRHNLQSNASDNSKGSGSHSLTGDECNSK
jgi:hypothetical protein